MVPLRACSFYYGDIANLRSRILNIDQLEMKHALVSGGFIVQLGETIGNHQLCFTFGFTTHCLPNASEESYKNSSHPGSFAFFQGSTVISFNISEIQLLFLFRKAIKEVMGVARN